MYPINFKVDFTVLALLITTLIFLIIKKYTKSKSLTANNLPPGPKKLPIIGDLHRLSMTPFRPFANLAKTYGSLMYLQLGEIPVIVVSSPEIAKIVLKEQDPNFADRTENAAAKILLYNCKDIAFAPYGSYWRQMRKICIVELLSAKSVRSIGKIRNDEISSLIRSIQLSAGQPFNLTDKIFSMMSSITCRAAFGKVCKDKDLLLSLSKEGLEMVAGFSMYDFFPSSKIVDLMSFSTKMKLSMMRHKLDVILDGIIDEHKANLVGMAKEDINGKDSSRRMGNGEFGNEDLVDVLLRIEQSGELEFPIDNDNIKAVILDMFTAGADTSSSTTDWAMTELLRHPKVLAKAQAEVRDTIKGGSGIKFLDDNDLKKLKYLNCVIKEVFRLHPPVGIIPRVCRDETKINGYTIPAKVDVLVNTWAIQRDSKNWTNPESFIPERFENNAIDFVGGDFEYLPFGSGRRMCPGMSFGLANVELHLAQLLYNFKWKLPDGVDPINLNLTQTPGLTASRREKLFVVATSHD